MHPLAGTIVDHVNFLSASVEPQLHLFVVAVDDIGAARHSNSAGLLRVPSIRVHGDRVIDGWVDLDSDTGFA